MILQVLTTPKSYLFCGFFLALRGYFLAGVPSSSMFSLATGRLCFQPRLLAIGGVASMTTRDVLGGKGFFRREDCSRTPKYDFESLQGRPPSALLSGQGISVDGVGRD